MRPDMHPYIHARNNPEKPAYIIAGSGETVTYRQLDQQSNRIAQFFRSLGLLAGVGPDDEVEATGGQAGQPVVAGLVKYS